MNASTVPAAVIAVLALAGSGCGTYPDTHVHLTYPPGQREGTKSEPYEAPSTARIVAPGVTFVTFSDRRMDKAVVGAGGKNFPSTRRSPVIADNSVADWVTRALAMELEKAGYTVLVASEAPASPDHLIVTGEILEVHCTPHWNQIAQVDFAVRVERDGREIFGGTYEDYDASVVNWDYSPDEYERALSRALEKAARRFAADLNAIPEAH